MSYYKFVQAYQEIDNRTRTITTITGAYGGSRKLYGLLGGSQRPTSQRAATEPAPRTSQTTTTTTVSVGDPIDLSAISSTRGTRPPGPLTPKERAYRRAYNLYNYYGKSRHLISKCPYLEKYRISGARSNVSGVESTVAEGSSTPQSSEALKAQALSKDAYRA